MKQIFQLTTLKLYRCPTKNYVNILNIASFQKNKEIFEDCSDIKPNSHLESSQISIQKLL